MSLPNLYSINDLLPGVAYDINFGRSVRGLRGMPRRLLLVGHKLTAGNAVLGRITRAYTEAEAIALCGEGSMLIEMWRAAWANCDSSMPIDIYPAAPNGTAVAAATTLVVTNSGANVQTSGEVMLYIGGVRLGVGVTTSDTAATVAAKLIDAINAVPSLPVTAAATATPSEVKLTCRWGGLTGNQIDVRSNNHEADILPQGLTLTIPAMAGGATNPDLSGLAAAMNGYRATEIANPFTDATNMNLVEVELEKRWGALNKQDSQMAVVVRGDAAAINTWLAGRNSPQVHMVPVTKDVTNPWATAAMVAAAAEQRAVIDPAQPHTGVVLQGYIGPRLADHWSESEAKSFFPAGGSPLAISEDRKGSLQRMVTNYATNVSGAPDASIRELCWVKTMSYIRWFTVTEYQIKYVGFKLGVYVDQPIPGQKIMTRNLIEEIQVGIYGQLMNAGLVQNMDHYKSTLVVELDGPNGKVKVQDEPVLITQHYQTEITSYPIAGQV